ncbi:MAG: porin family protein [Alphaproteobacteria bacterium]|nr:porin family protein [Alphaproteobacteria bacterium]
MKKLVSTLAIMLIAAPAIAAPSYLKRDSDGGYNVTYDYTDKAKTGWYGTARAELSFLNWKNKYSTDYTGVFTEYGSDSYSMEPVFGGSLSVGRRFGYFWRGEVEAGYIGNFTDKDDGFEFELSIPYLTANAYYDFTSGLYVGAGIGAAMPTTKMDGLYFTDNGNRTHRGFGVDAGVMVGYSHKLDDNFVLDLRYRLAGISGVKQTREIMDATDTYDFQVKTGFIMDNSISLGIRYEF